jgi:predicted  nucleic acid-binding Zn-ribbon protein
VLETEPGEVDNLRAQLSEVETKLQRKTAQLQAKDNQITNLRERLSRAHDSLEVQRGGKPPVNQSGANG